MYVIGIIGGLGSGKSLVARYLAGQGVALVEGDRLGHEVLAEPAVIEALRERWGEDVLDPEGQIDRAAVAARVFASPPAGPAELAFLEGVTHPRIAALLNERLDQLRQSGAGMVVVDAAVMLKAGWDRFCDLIIYVDAPRQLRLARCRKRGWSEEQFDLRQRAQLPLGIKRDRADITIDNSGSPESALSQLTQTLTNRGIWP